MELNINISDSTYEAIMKYENINFDELFVLLDDIRNGVPADESLNVKKDSKTNPVDEVTTDSEDKVHAKIDDTKNELKKNVAEFTEVCRLMTVYLGRGFTVEEAHILCLYDTIRQNKEMLAVLDGPQKLFVKMLIRSLVS